MRKIANVGTLANRYGISTEGIAPELLALPVFQNGRLKTTLAKAVYEGGTLAPKAVHMGTRILGGSLESRREVFAHEVAHLVAGFDADHGPRWVAAAKALGCSGSQFAPKEVVADIGSARKVVAKCTECGHEVRRTRRLPKRNTYNHGGGCGGRLVTV